ncbi:MAG: DUF3465 domain-containing protein [Xanthomonadales bacterium]|nr:DUF3465 domain-containing protein [Gammaproteobacteria bacterium]MBT8055259.1 DUF3465 domain-containing protein [Gammaproteobacteria bacterium]NND55791.1 DUF3465 domain-containing protein [Xanthomonadales bacterium]NNK50055.1 DUF3465 domain-containing protein [Xanthomonadales bacterium]
MKKYLPIIIIAFLAYGYIQYQDSAPSGPSSMEAEIALQHAFANGQSDVQVKGAGIVKKLLRDDNDGSRHQKFIVMLGSGETVLISHNIDLAPRINDLSEGDRVDFFGEYEWNSKGGVIHWTHHDPAGRHIAGWIKHQGKTYQ